MTRPEVGAMSPAMDMSKVVLPQPEGPTKETNSLGSTWQEMFPIAKVVSPPSWRYVLERLWTSRIGTGTNHRKREYWSIGMMEYRASGSALFHYSNTPVLHSKTHALGATSLMTSLALVAREISLYFCVRSMVAWRSLSDIFFSKSGSPIFPARSGLKPAHLIIEFRLPSGSA